MSRSRIRPSVPALGQQSAVSADLLREIVDPHGRHVLARTGGAHKSRGQNTRDWARVIVASIARGVLATVLGLAFYAAAPAVIGWHPTTEMTASMMPRIRTGDVVVSVPVAAEAVQVGKVILFDDPDHPGKLRLHRFVEWGDGGMLRTAGDANPQPDSTPVHPSAVWGVGMLRVPWVGLPILWIREGQWLFVALVSAGLTLLIGLTGLDRRLRTRVQDPAAGPPDTPPRARPAWPFRAGAAAAATLFVAGSLVSFGPTPAALAAGFTGTTVNSTSRFTAGTVPLATGLTCTDNADGRTVTIGWTYGGTVVPDSFDVLNGNQVVASTTTGSTTSAVVTTNAILSLFPSYTLTVRANITANTAWSSTSTSTTSVKLTGLLLSPVRCNT
ncbi:hypothetical protein [Frondihabitans sp. VKM Ac-2883]|uniref:hypothetical protein n=1 Tax=Frondihabitans sp. VKM Ac-2883 TaxID=2783823 RepID=UPI00188C9E59|nr:hypothetical protein [Frondihabitans sp. VKM Ac-2883]MBF4575535.1 hypothetical protein [Frondihabitans sp. VKM Ac-2883]